MNCNDEWIVLDTETTGLKEPIFPIEIGAQRMRGWKPDGEPFRRLINFDVPIEPDAELLHGYSREYLRKHGSNPAAALLEFTEWAGSAPFVSYNLAYDWERVLEPAYRRLGLACALVPGFCAVRLVRSTIPGMRNYKLITLMRAFDVASEQKHNALDDVAGVVELLGRVIGPHFDRHDIRGFDCIAQCADGTLEPPLLDTSGARSGA